MTAAERATLSYIDSMVRQTEGDVSHLRRVVAGKRAASVDLSLSPAERAYNFTSMAETSGDLGDAISRLDDWKQVRDAVAYLFTMRED